MTDRQPGYDAVIPARVRYDPELPDKAKLLYGEIRALASRDGFCWATNEYFSRLYEVSERTVQRMLSALTDRRHIFTEVLRDEATQAVLERRLWVDRARFLARDRDLPPQELDEPPHDKIVGTPPDKIVTTPPDNFVTTPPDKIVVENNTSKNSTSEEDPPVVPPAGGRRARTKREPRKAPDWKPERFAGFWSYYPRGENKQKAMDAWDRLKPSDELIDRIAKSLVILKGTRDWQEGVGIPHAATWLNNARWEDAEGLDAPAAGPGSGGWAPDPEVMGNG